MTENKSGESVQVTATIKHVCDPDDCDSEPNVVIDFGAHPSYGAYFNGERESLRGGLGRFFTEWFGVCGKASVAFGDES